MLTVTDRRLHDTSGTDALSSPSSGAGAWVSDAGYYCDLDGRTRLTAYTMGRGGMNRGCSMNARTVLWTVAILASTNCDQGQSDGF